MQEHEGTQFGSRSWVVGLCRDKRIMSGIPPVGAFSEPQLRRSRAAPLPPRRISSFRPSDEELAHETLTTVTVVGSEESRTLLSPRIAPDGRKKKFRRERNGGHKSVASRATSDVRPMAQSVPRPFE